MFTIHTPNAELHQEGRILDAARSCFLHFGYPKTSMREIAAECRMSAANLYRFYPGKLAIGAAVAERERQTMLGLCDRAVATAPSNLVSRLSALFYSTIDFTRRQLREEPFLFELGILVTREMPELRASLLDETRRRIGLMLADALVKGEIAEGDLERRVSVVHLATAPFVLPWLLANQPFGDVRSRVPDLVSCLVAGLGTGPSQQSV